MQAKQYRQLQENQLTDIEVVNSVLAGEKDLYEVLMRRYNQKLYRVIRAYLKDECETEDAMQNTYLKAYEKLHQFKGTAQFSTWLLRIGINEALGQIRRNGRLAALNAAPSEEHLLQSPVTTDSMDPETKTIQKEVLQLLEKAIDALPATYRVVYVMREIEELSTSDITACLGISESNVNVRLHRARLLLKESLYELSTSRHIFAFGNERCDRLVEKVMAILTAA